MRREIESTNWGFNRDKLPQHAWVYPDGKIHTTHFTNHRNTAAKIVENNPVWKEEFILSNKNKGYDEAEFLIIVKGFISINSGHFNFSRPATYSQERALGCNPFCQKIKRDMFFSD